MTPTILVDVEYDGRTGPARVVEHIVAAGPEQAMAALRRLAADNGAALIARVALLASEGAAASARVVAIRAARADVAYACTVTAPQDAPYQLSALVWAHEPFEAQLIARWRHALHGIPYAGSVRPAQFAEILDAMAEPGAADVVRTTGAAP